MQEHDDSNNMPTPIANTSNLSIYEVWEQRIAIVIFSVVFFVLIVCAGLLIQTYIISYKPVVEMFNSESRFLKPGLELLAYFILFFMGDYLAEVIESKTSILVVTKQKRIKYILFIAVFFLFWSFWLLFNRYNLEQEGWEYLSTVNLGISFVAIIVSTLISTRKRLSVILRLISYIFLLVGVVLIFLDVLIYL